LIQTPSCTDKEEEKIKIAAKIAAVILLQK
jgi:hypothetical protein